MFFCCRICVGGVVIHYLHHLKNLLYIPSMNNFEVIGYRFAELVETNPEVSAFVILTVLAYVAYELIKPKELNFKEMKLVIYNECLNFHFKDIDAIFEKFEEKIAEREALEGISYRKYLDSSVWASSKLWLVNRVLEKLIKEGKVKSRVGNKLDKSGKYMLEYCKIPDGEAIRVTPDNDFGGVLQGT